MLYHWYELGHAAVRPVRVAADSCRMMLTNPFNPLTHTAIGRQAAAALEVFERTTRRYDKPEFGIPRTIVDGAEVGVTEEVVWRHPFCRLVHFRRDVPLERRERDPRLLLVAPMSGHYATLLRGTVEAFLPDHEVYITDWQDARDVPVAAGGFDLDDYIIVMRDIFRHMRGDVHVFAVCQPSVPVLAATALMETDEDPHVPQSLIMAGGPIDTRISPTVVNQLAEKKGTEWFRRNVITAVPWPSAGFGRKVYPGFLQLSGFMTMNLDRHVNAHKDLFFHLVRGDGDSAEKHREFYDEYLAVMDLTAEFYLQTVDAVFVRHLMPRGLMMHRGRRVDLSRIRRVAIMTVEGEKDDITGVGQCRAAQDLCSGVPAARKQHFECPKVGHYGVFNGSRFRREIAPRIAEFARRHDGRTTRGVMMPAIDRRKPEAAVGKRPTEPSAAAFTFGNDNSDAVAVQLPAKAPVIEAAATAPSGAAPGALAMWVTAGALAVDLALKSSGMKPLG
ncbi:MAG: polyhydroxyalkanoate depolymerase [Hyphomicrobiaceae bacterium]|nr:polyhydroxyalkanoate depolymerase [Hyphomicrobiaceae bacterium]